jgi:hypothetical protein
MPLLLQQPLQQPRQQDHLSYAAKQLVYCLHTESHLSLRMNLFACVDYLLYIAPPFLGYFVVVFCLLLRLSLSPPQVVYLLFLVGQTYS